MDVMSIKILTYLLLSKRSNGVAFTFGKLVFNAFKISFILFSDGEGTRGRARIKA
jgi:hypothetical protein